MSMLQHPNIVTYYGIEVHREKVYLFMELCTRGSLAKLIQEQGRVDEVTARLFVVQMLRGLRYLHASGICHRDIKCDNTLLDDSMTIKLVDFGAAKVLNRQSLAMRTRRGRDGATLTGTPMYMAPEVITGPAAERPEPGALGAQDIWSLGCCIVEMLTGSAPWAHLDNEWAIMYHVVADSPPLPDASLVGSDGLDFLQKCFTRAPSKRPTAEELLKHKWVCETLVQLEQAELRGVPPSRLAPDYDVQLDMDAMTPAEPRSRAPTSFLDSPSAQSASSLGSIHHVPSPHGAFGSPLPGRTPGSTQSSAWPYNKAFGGQFHAESPGSLGVYNALDVEEPQINVPNAQTLLSKDGLQTLSSDEQLDVAELTRKAVSALLRLPLEGSDVSGVAGWLGQDNTPLALLDEDEVKETVAATSQIVVRQRELQIRKQQEMRGALGKRSRSPVEEPAFVPLKSEPPALYPLPPEDEEEGET
ncbi:Suppressor of Sensor Kinase (SLN1) [Linderina pennispora]|nr:Suppressor of Sensor Kinase (SLN1) [Linderina pennispora]